MKNNIISVIYEIAYNICPNALAGVKTLSD